MKLLVVDDDPTIRAVVEVIFEDMDEWQVLLAESGEMGIGMAISEKPDLLVIDMNMPGLSGPETVAKLRENSEVSNIPVVLLTADPNAGEVCEQLNAKGFIIKPFDPMSLPDQISKFIK